MELQFKVENQKISRVDNHEVVAHSKNYLTARFIFSDDWTGVAKTAVFKHGDDVYNVLLDNDTCFVPCEVITPDYFTVSVFGGDLITVDKSDVFVCACGLEEGQPPAEPTPDVYTQILNVALEAKETAQSVREDADAGKFKGDKGEQGEKGEDGKNGIDGVNGKDATINGYNAVQIVGEGSVEVETVDNVIKIKSSGGESVDLTEIEKEIKNLQETKANKSEIPVVPTKTSDLLNNSGYITSSALSGYATTEYVNNAINSSLSTVSNVLDAINGEIV